MPVSGCKKGSRKWKQYIQLALILLFANAGRSRMPDPFARSTRSLKYSRTFMGLNKRIIYRAVRIPVDDHFRLLNKITRCHVNVVETDTWIKRAWASGYSQWTRISINKKLAGTV